MQQWRRHYRAAVERAIVLKKGVRVKEWRTNLSVHKYTNTPANPTELDRHVRFKNTVFDVDSSTDQAMQRGPVDFFHPLQVQTLQMQHLDRGHVCDPIAVG